MLAILSPQGYSSPMLAILIPQGYSPPMLAILEVLNHATRILP